MRADRRRGGASFATLPAREGSGAEVPGRRARDVVRGAAPSLSIKGRAGARLPVRRGARTLSPVRLARSVLEARRSLAGFPVLSLAAPGLLVNMPQYQRTTPMIKTPSAVLIISGNRSINGYPMVMAVDLPPASEAFDISRYAVGTLTNKISGGCTTAVKTDE